MFQQQNSTTLDMKVLSSVVATFVYKSEQQLRDDFGYKKNMFILVDTDHRLVQAFFDLKPMKTQVAIDLILLSSSVKSLT